MPDQETGACLRGEGTTAVINSPSGMGIPRRHLPAITLERNLPGGTMLSMLTFVPAEIEGRFHFLNRADPPITDG